ncbi:MAG: LysR family transcriptional regulator [Beijerinckiaceae bacterium]
MEFSALRLMRAVAETGSVSRAALELNCVQSNVTARLRRLEDDLGAPLFVRTARGMVPTPAGRVLEIYAQRLLSLAEEAKRAVLAASQGVASLRLGSMETTAAVRLPNVLACFHKDYPAVELSLTTGTSESIIAEVLERRLDAGLVTGSLAHPDLAARQVYSEELVLVDDGSHRPKTALLAFRRGCTYRALAEDLLRGMGPLHVMELGTLDGILGCVAAGMGCAVLPRAAVERPQYAGTLRIHALDGKLAEVPTFLIWRKDAPLHTAREAFATLLSTMASAAVV